jgi:predicted AAA+ superfamily ATPase
MDSKISKALSVFGGVLITGPRYCGKSWTGLRHSNSALFLGNEDANSFAALNPMDALEGERPRLIDEWQDVPKLWDFARRDIDLSNRRGMYIFTGSSVPPSNSTSHTGIGRFARLQMKTMSLFESGDSDGSAKLSDLFRDGAVERRPSRMDYPRMVRLICRGGWPAAIGMDDGDAASMSQNYVQSIASMDLSRVDGRKRSASTASLVMKSLARNNATLASVPTIAADVGGSGRGASELTVRSYIDALKKLFVIEEQPAWHPSLRSRTRVRSSPKRHFTDPSLAAAALGASHEILMRDTRTAGLLFESLCYRDLSVYASAVGGRVFHYRDDSGLEADAIVELDDGRWGAAEVKLGYFEFDKAAANLIRLKEKMIAGGAPDPSFLMILSASGGGSRVRPDGVAEVPVDLLGP